MKKSRLLAASLAAVALVTVPLIAIGANRPDPSTAVTATDLALIGGIMRLVEQAYVHPVGHDELTKDALKGMLSRLDPHSDYMDEQEYKEMQTDLAGKFGGLGIEISQQGGVPKVISPIDDTPAARAGIQPGDLIVSIDGHSTHGVDLSKIVRQLRGNPGTSVKITIARGSDAPFDVTITRDTIRAPNIKSKLHADNIGYVRISEFDDGTGAEFKQAIKSLEQQAGGKLAGLVIDLRDNPGGLLSAAVDVSGDFLDGGIVVSVHGRNAREDQALQAPARGDMLKGTRVVVLINGASASASEIVAGALQDRHRATIMGTQSFGKGSVQAIVPLRGHGAVRLTTALYYTPAGRSIQGRGVSPDVTVEAPKDQQAPGAIILRESTLEGAFANPGSLGGKPNSSSADDDNSDQSNGASTVSPPIKAELIGTPDDGQLKAALAWFAGKSGGTTGSVTPPASGAAAPAGAK
jgi:carboxyl-terminal processing protease